ncbi:vacuolar protein sorting-associated protein 18 homolog [Galendromus occidentalis]|uniref:Vacuolar protein sorting-associated protein 18 homolog n=1 Tax=Galendromus occidentalis TaxID=34638 RepID=A0AAJ6QNM8_9ACAR|nr:vacuolar protein sorting-associated protein 18 homolog [Galendromus occidentalis]
MASLFEQYEQQSSGAAGRPNRAPNPAVPQNPVARLMKSEPETPMFKKTKVEFRPEQTLTHLVACSDILVMGMMNKTLLKANLKNFDQPEELPLSPQLSGSPTQYRLHRVFLDPLGNHLIVSILQGESGGTNFYVYLGGTSGKRTYHKFMKGHLVTAVAFNPDNRQNVSSGSILLGTSKGAVFEAELVAGSESDWGRFNSKQTPEKYCKQIYQMEDEPAICGLHMESVSAPALPICQTVVFLNTARFVYRFFGQATPTADVQPVFERLFSTSKTWAYNNTQELPNPTRTSVLKVLIPRGQPNATHLGCLFGPVGVYHADLIISANSDGPWLSFSEDPSILELTAQQGEVSISQQPIAMVLSNYHILVLFNDRLRVYCQLDHSLVMEDVFPQGRMVGLSKDPTSGLIWAFSETSVYRYKADREDRRMWKVLLAKKRYEDAKLFCKDDNFKLNKIRVRQAQDLFKQGQYERSAEMFSETWSSFEEVSLRFMEVEQDSALRIVLKEKLLKLTHDKTQRPQLVMIVTWLLQLYLNRMGHLKHQLSKDVSGESLQAEFDTLEKEFQALFRMRQVKTAIMENKKPFYKLIANHGDEPLLLEFSKMMEDFGHVVQQHIQHKRFEDALDVLVTQRSPELYYRFSPELMIQLPEQLVEAWLRENLDPVRLIPALVQYSDADFDPRAPQMLQSIRYLEFCVNECMCVDESIHNYLIALYARLGDSEKLEEYLAAQGTDISLIPYDPKYALRVFSELKLLRASIHIYTVMGLYAEALELSLNELGDVKRAEEIANVPEDDDIRKKLWLMIAKHVVSEKQDIGHAMKFLQTCDLLKIEDILPFFPEFACIDHFKEAICESLQSYKGVIKELRDNMDEATKAADEIRQEIQEVKNRCFVVDRTHKCASCGFALLNQAFYIFACSHRFHASCLQRETVPYLKLLEAPKNSNSEQDSTDNHENSSSRSSSQIGHSEKERTPNDVAASECLYCGELMADAISVPFFARDEYEKVRRQWV